MTAVLGRVLCARAVLSLYVFTPLDHVSAPQLPSVAGAEFIVTALSVMTDGNDAAVGVAQGLSMILSFPALTNLDFIILNDAADHGVLRLLCQTLSAPHAPRLQTLSIGFNAFNEAAAVMLAPVLQRLSPSLADFTARLYRHFDDAGGAALISALSCVLWTRRTAT
jgi:hypothetical protein